MRESNYLKAGVAGIAGSLAMFILMRIGLATGMAPFNIPPSAAFLMKLGILAKPLGLIAHFFYGTLWAVLLAGFFKEKVTILKGVGLSVFLWIIMMFIISPIIGWGVFGFSEATELAKNEKLYLENPLKYVVATLFLHLIYGITVGAVEAKWAVKNNA